MVAKEVMAAETLGVVTKEVATPGTTTPPVGAMMGVTAPKIAKVVMVAVKEATGAAKEAAMEAVAHPEAPEVPPVAAAGPCVEAKASLAAVINKAIALHPIR